MAGYWPSSFFACLWTERKMLLLCVCLYVHHESVCIQYDTFCKQSGIRWYATEKM